jgi:hypothetical protein
LNRVMRVMGWRDPAPLSSTCTMSE